MKKYNLLILICCFLLCCVTSYAQHDHQSGQYDDGDIQFEFELELMYNDTDIGNQGNIVGIEIIMTNTSESSIDKDILFQVYVSEGIPLEMPDTYDAERVLELSKTPLSIGHSDDVFIPLDTKNRDKVITIWPLVSAHKSARIQEDTPYITAIIPSKRNENTISDINIYPNPTQGNLYIETLDNQTRQVAIYSKTGQPVKIFDGAISGLATFDLKDLVPDVYFIIIRNEHGQITHHSKLILDK